MGSRNLRSAMELSQLPDVAIEMKPHIVPAAVDDGPYGIDVPVAPTTISWKNLVYKVPDGKGTKQLLRHISGILRPGEMTAVIGPSGAGKTTLLNALAGFQTRSFEADLFVNGHPFKERSFRKLSSYVMSGDDLLQHLTVRETVDAAAKLKLPSDVPYKQRSALVSRILKLWGLDSCENRQVKNLSTGQRKRVMLAQELVYSPPVLFMDEPTSGLDSSSALQCVLTLKQFARKGHTVACSIHQPSSRIFQLFDRLYVLGDGYCLYHGTVRELLPTLTANGLQCPAFYNPADFLIEVASGEYGDVKGDLVRYAERHNDVFSTNPAPKSLANGGDHLNEPLAVLAPLLKQEDHGLVTISSCSVQMNVLLKRCYLSLIRNPMVFHLRLATHLLVGVCMGLLYYDIGGRADSFFNNATLVFFSIIFLTFTGMMPVVLSYPLEAAVFTRERNNSWYTLKAYYLSKSIVELPFQVAYPTLFVAIVYWMTSQPPEMNRFVMFLFLSILLTLVAHSLGTLIGAFASVQVAVFLAPAVAIPMLLFSGFVVTLKAMPSYLHWISYVSFVRYAYEGCILSVYGFDRPELECDEQKEGAVPCLFTEPSDFVSFLGLNVVSVEVCAGALIVFVVLLNAATYVALKMRVKRTF
ncbi:ATP-binding cassette subfamily G member 4-like isoform X2 [Dermacentor variabilis]|uniref:ATP-binding cassette subfamily G member 4-like isoform X2 n=1 Tax=Dermacentor variabilis TaxID=34621 RepID=UPI003F5BFB1F